ncbi:DUF2196 domain-containing protein [bacterium]|nr:DUF2196 domain-containing protein [Mariniblastus sp.]MDB4461543.1 DUF2196 domain-containing protein [bacterium]
MTAQIILNEYTGVEMSSDGKSKDAISIGLRVQINPKEDKTREIIVEGAVSRILSNTEFHSHGILVELESGEIGRVKKILSESKSKPSAKATEVYEQKLFSGVVQPSIGEIFQNSEDHFVEFKSSMLWSQALTQEQIEKSKLPDIKQYGRSASLIIIAKTIGGFLNSDGGTLLIGVKENKDTNNDEVIGVDSEFGKLKDPCADGYRRKILDTVVKPYLPGFVFNHFNNYLKIEFCKINGKQVCGIRINKSDAKVFMKLQNKDRFFVRIDASTRELIGEEIVDYCIKRFAY